MRIAFEKVVLDLEEEAFYLDSILSKYILRRYYLEDLNEFVYPVFYKNTRRVIGGNPFNHTDTKKDEYEFKNLLRELRNGKNINSLADVECKLPWKSLELIRAFVLDVIHSDITKSNIHKKLLYKNPFTTYSAAKPIINITTYPNSNDIVNYLTYHTLLEHPNMVNSEDINNIYLRLMNIAEVIRNYTDSYKNGVFDIIFTNINCILEYKGTITDVRYIEAVKLNNDR